jgi:hypothetical protein
MIEQHATEQQKHSANLQKFGTKRRKTLRVRIFEKGQRAAKPVKHGILTTLAQFLRE